MNPALWLSPEFEYASIGWILLYIGDGYFMVIPSYREFYLPYAQEVLGSAFEEASLNPEIGLSAFYVSFLASDYSRYFARGFPSVVMGNSGREFCWKVMRMTTQAAERKEGSGKLPEYWAGWALAYFQWWSSCSFQEIASRVPLKAILALYGPYHEMDVQQFCDKMAQLMSPDPHLTPLAIFRRHHGS